MSADHTLPTLIALTRSKPVERSLCCPECGSDIVRERGEYLCLTCEDEFESLAELAVREVRS